MKKMRLIAGLLALMMLVGMLPTTAMAAGTDDLTGLIDVAPQSTVTVPGAEEGKPAENLVDGNLNTLWVANGGIWPSNVDFALPGNLLVKRIEVDFERFDGRTFDLQIGYAVNNVTSDYSTLPAVSGHSANETYVCELESPQRMTHVRVSLLGTNGLAWPSMAEVRIYAVDERIDLDDYDDITAYASESQGAGYQEWDFGSNQQVVGFRATLADGASATVKGRMKRETGWTTYVSELADGDNVLSFPTGMSAVRVELDDVSKLTGFQIFGTYTAPAVDSGSVAFDKPTHGNFDAATSYLVNDGDTATVWQPEMYPAYVDIDLEENYNISEIQVTTPSAGYSQYSVYTSIDGRDFDLVGEKENDAACAAGGDKFTFAAPKEARIVRVYLEYYSENTRPGLNEVRVVGEASGTAVQTAPEVNVGSFEDSAYAAPITEADVVAEVQGIVRRQVGAAYVDWFTFAIAPQSNGYDYFTLSDEGGKVKITGNNGVSLATGVNHYLKYFCNVHISQVGNQVNMPAAVVPVGTAVHRETKFPVRYAYNYCTHSYSMAFWGEDEWRNELDWLALNGVNVVLDVTGQEEVWRQFLMKVGYTHQEAKDFLAGPGYYAWAYMANLTGFGGPVHDSWLTERTELGRSNQRIMRTLGMEPVLQAFSGMVPVDIATHDAGAASDIIPQGVWCSFQRPAMLKTDSATYDRYAALFYEAQKDVFGDAKYYATDPFHEGGDTGGMAPATVSSALLDSLLEFDSDAVWVIQSWQGNPTNGLLNGLKQGTDCRAHALVLDLYAEKVENWKGNVPNYPNSYGSDTDGDGLTEFSDTPWVWCQLNNFGGRMGLHGHLDALAENIPAAANTARHMAGIGIAPEGSQENPLLYDFLFETIWTQDADGTLSGIDVDQWLVQYARRRYGAESESAQEALKILSETVYKSELNMAGQGAPESVVNARPALSINAASTWGNSTISYDKVELEKAARLLLADYDILSESDAYLYDVADVLKQVLSNSAQSIHSKMAAAYTSRDAEEFAAQAERFLALIDLEEQVLGTRKEFLFGTWTTNASELAANADDFTQRLYLRNAKALVTTWGSIQQCNAGGLSDYSNRQWAGLAGDYYKARWTTWINACKANLNNNVTAAPSFDWFPWEWAYARDGEAYTNQPNGLDIKTLGERVLEEYGAGPEAQDTYDIDRTAMTVKAGSQETASEDGAAGNVLDNNNATIWHTQYTGSTATRDQLWIAFDLGQEMEVGGLRYLPRQSGGENGIITGYQVYVSSSDTDWAGTTNSWTLVDSGSWARNRDWKKASFDAVSARYVKLTATASVEGFATASEIRVTMPVPVQVEEYTITYDLAGGTLAQANPERYTAETESFTLNNPTREGYTFAGWTGTGLTEATMTVTIAKGSTGDRSYTATWTQDVPPEPERYTITYDLAGGTLAQANPDSYTAETESFTLNNPTREGYTFAGWTGTGLTEATVTVTIAKGSTGDRSYTATWTQDVPPEPERYTITYDLAGGTLAQANPDSYTAETESFTLNNPTREGYTFAGWTGTGLTEATMTVTIAKGSTGDRSYTATWTQDEEPELPPAPPAPPAPPKPTTTTTTETTENGETVVTVTDLTTGDTTVTVSAPDGSRSEIVTQDGGTTVETTLTQAAVDNAEDGTVTLPVVGLNAQSEPVVTVTLPESAGAVTVNIPVEGTTAGTVAVRVNPDGTEEIITRSLTENGVVTVPLDETGTIRIIDNSKSFRDVGENDWFAEDVAYASSRELFKGTGEEIFSPKAAMSRGMLAAVLYRYAGEPEASGADFEDVRSDAYYSDAIGWAAQNNVVSGMGENRFAPDAAVSREQLAVMLYRFAGSPDTDGSALAAFADEAQVSEWARPAMDWAVSQGIIRGTGGGRLAPGAGAARAEVAAMLHRFTQAVIRQEKP